MRRKQLRGLNKNPNRKIQFKCYIRHIDQFSFEGYEVSRREINSVTEVVGRDRRVTGQ